MTTVPNLLRGLDGNVVLVCRQGASSKTLSSTHPAASGLRQVIEPELGTIKDAVVRVPDGVRSLRKRSGC